MSTVLCTNICCCTSLTRHLASTSSSTLAPPSAPQLYLQIPPNQLTGQWALLCLTSGFHPDNLTLTWTYRSALADIDHLSVISCTIPAVSHHGNLSTGPPNGTLTSPDWMVKSMSSCQPQCFQMMDNLSGESYLFSLFLLPQKQSLDAGLTFTCRVQDHPALTTAVTASFTWGKEKISSASPHFMHCCMEVCIRKTHWFSLHYFLNVPQH